MDGDIGELLQSVLSDPEQMGKITAMAQSLMGGGESAGGQDAPAAPAHKPEGETMLLRSLSGLLTKQSAPSRSTALLTAMRPYMRPEKQEKLDRAMQAARLARVAGEVMKELGGGGHGI